MITAAARVVGDPTAEKSQPKVFFGPEILTVTIPSMTSPRIRHPAAREVSHIAGKIQQCAKISFLGGFYMNMRVPMFLASMLLTGVSTASSAAVIYSNNFSGSATGFTGTNSIATANNGQMYLGMLGQGASTTLTLNTLNITAPLSLSFDLYAIYTVDGEGPAGGNSPSFQDSFVVTAGGTIFNYSFANYGGDTQSYPVPGSAGRTGSDATLANALYGYDATYHFANLVVTPTGATTSITFTSNTNQSLDDEAYGIDNVSVTGTVNAVSGVPEPASWAMMIGGFGMIGGVLRRRPGPILNLA